jgi:hypothetical protein
MTLYGWVLPAGLTSGLASKLFRLGVVSAVLGACCWRRPPTLASVLRRGAVLVIVFASLSVFYSGQWILWFSPLLLPLVRRHRALGWGVAALDVITYLTYPVWSSLVLSPYRIAWLLPEGAAPGAIQAALGVLVYARFVVLGFLVYSLVRGEFQKETVPSRELLPVAAAA